MRILLNALSARLGGGQTYIVNLLKHVPQSAEWKIFLLCQDSLDLNEVPPNVERICVEEQLMNPFKRAIWEELNLYRLARKHGCDSLFCPGGLLPHRRSYTGLHTAITFQNMLPFNHQQRKRYPCGYRRLRDFLLERGLTRSIKSADLVIFISQYANVFIEQKLNAEVQKKTVIPHGVASSFFPSENKAAKLPTQVLASSYYLYVSFIDYYKSQIEVVRAFALFRKQNHTSELLYLVGAENAEYGNRLRREIQELGLSDSVIILGNLPHDSLPALYQNARINLFASTTENCPNILLEMLASKRPALVSNRSPMPEFGRNDVTYFDPSNIEELAQHWINLENNFDHAELLAKRAHDRVYSMKWKNVAAETWSAIELAKHRNAE